MKTTIVAPVAIAALMFATLAIAQDIGLNTNIVEMFAADLQDRMAGRVQAEVPVGIESVNPENVVDTSAYVERANVLSTLIEARKNTTNDTTIGERDQGLDFAQLLPRIVASPSSAVASADAVSGVVGSSSSGGASSDGTSILGSRLTIETLNHLLPAVGLGAFQPDVISALPGNTFMEIQNKALTGSNGTVNATTNIVSGTLTDLTGMANGVASAGTETIASAPDDILVAGNTVFSSALGQARGSVGTVSGMAGDAGVAAASAAGADDVLNTVDDTLDTVNTVAEDTGLGQILPASAASAVSSIFGIG